MTQPLEILFHPAKTHPIKAALLAFGLGVGFQAVFALVEPLTAVALCFLLCASVRDFFVPTQTVFTAEGISVRGLLKGSRVYPWRRFRAFVEDRNGLFLTPYQSRRRSETVRGVFFPMPRQDRQRAVEFCLAQQLIRRSA